MRIVHVVGARPNFVKAAAVHRALAACGAQQAIIHTGQHYDWAMSQAFFAQLDLPEPDCNLQVGRGSYATRMSEMLLGLERELPAHTPDWVLAYGDVDSTLAAALSCSRLVMRLAHVEAGLRSGDKSMPEEVNRIITDRLSQLLFTPSPDGDVNLAREGITSGVHLVGNVMIDTLVRMLPASHSAVDCPSEFALLTLHRPGNVDDLAFLQAVLQTLGEFPSLLVLFPAHPRLRTNLQLLALPRNVQLLDPLPYLDFLSLHRRAKVLITDSGGLQEESTYLQVPCLTLRENTERPITVREGTNTVVGRNPERLAEELRKILAGDTRPSRIPELWDGKAAERIAAVMHST